MSSKIISLESYLNIVSSYIYNFVICINTFLVKFKVIYEQVFAHNTTYSITNRSDGSIVCHVYTLSKSNAVDLL